MMPKAFTVLLFMASHVVSAQHSAASIAFFNDLSDCANSLGGWKCLELDLSSEAAIDNDTAKVYFYSWSMGDGKRKEGNKIEHCYDDFGSYQIAMDLIDEETATVIRNELSATVDLYPEIQPVIIARRDNLPPSFIEFTGQYGDRGLFQPDRVFWRIDGQYFEGNTVMYSFLKPGVYLIEMGIEKDTELTGVITACATLEITVQGSDVWTTDIVRFFDSGKDQRGTGPFARTDIYCWIRSVRNAHEGVIVPLNFLMRAANIEADGEYEIQLFSGNAFTGKKRFIARGLKGNDLYIALKDTVSAFVKRPLTFLGEATVKDLANVALAEGPLQQVAVQLSEQAFKIEIGAYIHTGSRIKYGIQSSLRKGSLVKEALVKYGILPERISIASPEYHRGLMNTCSSDPDCDREDEALNGKVEFRITGINL